MANKYIKRSTSLCIKEMQIKTTLGFHFTPIRLAIIKETKTTNAGEDVGKKRKFYTLLVGISMEVPQKT
jgi:hypothetical protein